MTWSVVSVAPADGTCVLQASWLGINSYTGYGACARGPGPRPRERAHIPAAAGTFRIGSTPLDYPTCPNGFTVTFQATRSNDATLFARCTASVTVLQARSRMGGKTCGARFRPARRPPPQVAKPPVITDCGPRNVNERSIVGTAIGLPLAATNLNVGTSLLWTVTATAPGYAGNVITVGLCDGTLRVLQYSA